MIPTDRDILAAWAAYELRNARANAEYRRRYGAFREADRKAAARRLRVVAGAAAGAAA